MTNTCCIRTSRTSFLFNRVTSSYFLLFFGHCLSSLHSSRFGKFWTLLFMGVDFQVIVFLIIMAMRKPGLKSNKNARGEGPRRSFSLLLSQRSM